MLNNPAKIGPYRCGGGEKLFVIAGPCVIENESLTLSIAERLAKIARLAGANRVQGIVRQGESHESIGSYRGAGMEEGLRVLAKVARSDRVACHDRYSRIAPGGRGCRSVCAAANSGVSVAADRLAGGGRQTGRAVHVKKGQFMAPADMRHVVRKAGSRRLQNVILGERGTFFGYGRLVNDMRAIPQMQALGVPVIFDATHSVQEPGGLGNCHGRQSGDGRAAGPRGHGDWASMACSAKRTPIPISRRATGRTWSRSTNLRRLEAAVRDSHHDSETGTACRSNKSRTARGTGNWETLRRQVAVDFVAAVVLVTLAVVVLFGSQFRM